MELNDADRSIGELSAAKRALLERQLLKSSAREENRTIPRRAPSPACPLSFAQQRLWFLHQLDPRSAVYNISRAVRLRGPLRQDALAQTLDAIVARHEVLRTTFASVEGGPVQIIADRRSVHLRIVDLTTCPEPDRSVELGRRTHEEARRPFDLTQDLMLRALLIRLADADHVLSLTMHHIVSDGWSMGVLVREVADLYDAFAHGRPSPLPPLPIQFADYAVWQRQSLTDEHLAAQLAYWRERLAGAPEVLPLPTDRPRPMTQGFRGAHQSMLLPRALAESLRALSGREGVTLFMTLLAGFYALLHRYTGQEDIVVGSPIAGRARPEVEGLIGLFVNTLALRADLSGEPTFRALLGRVREAALGAYANQDLPFERLVGELGPERSPGLSPLFQVMLILQNEPIGGLRLSGLDSTPLAVGTGTAKFDLTVSVEAGDDGLATTLEYNTDLFDAATASRMLAHWRTLLEGAVARPDEAVSRLPLLTDTERRQLVVEWNDTRVEYAREACLHHLFEAQVERTPDDVAVTGDEGSLTYRQLNQRANRLAHYLRSRGVGPDVVVGLCVERSLVMLEALLGILKAGGAYLPLDPTYPKERVAFILADARPGMVVTQHHLSAGLPATADLVLLDSHGDAIAAQSPDNPVSGASAGHLAYVIYTSGSTGRPKGVPIGHRSVVNFLQAMRDRPGISGDDVLLAVTTLSFDIAVLELFLPLTVGARVVIATREIWDPRRLIDTLRRSRATVMQATPTTWRSLEEAGWSGASGLKALCGGEPLAPTLASWLVERCASVWNLYGPTETTVWSTVARVGPGVDRVVLGRPIANTQIYLLDRHLEPVPVGVRGELWIGGDGLARGYLGRPELTTERFITSPFGAEAGARLYRTGDFARYLPDGNLEFLGRADHQVKIRGYRIELGEIETVLGGHPAVQETVALVREDVPGDARLVAYVVARAGRTVTTGELRGYAREKLPPYMVPSAFVMLGRLPLTPNGKVDRRALPVPDPTFAEVGIMAPGRDPLEREVAKIWEAVLGVKPVGVRDNFFDLGGHSLLGVRLFARIEEILGKRVPVASLFRAPTVEQLVRAIREEGDAVASWSSLVAIQPAGSKPPLFCIHPHVGHVLCYYDLARALEPDQPVYGLQARGLDGIQAPCARIEDMARNYLREVRDVQPQGPYALGGYCFGGVIAFEMAQQLRSEGQDVALLALFDTMSPRRLRPLTVLRFHARRVVGLELAALARLDRREKLGYVLARAERVAMRMVDRIVRPRRPERPLDRALQEVEDAHLRALRAYAPRPYAGELALFLTRELAPPGVDPEADWNKVVTGGVRVYEIAGAGDHVTILDAPRVRDLVERLRRCMQRTQHEAR